MVTEAGRWRDPDPAGLYRETWLTLGVGRLETGAGPRRAEVTVSWGRGRPDRVTRTFALAAYQRTAVSLDTFAPDWTLPSRADALIEIRADGPLWAETAIYYQPLARGVVPAREGVRFTCER